MNYRYFYFVEGKCEKKLIDILKENQLIQPGQCIVFNATQEIINNTRLRMLPPRSIVVLIFDTDTKETRALMYNLAVLKQQKNVHETICVTQVKNLEEELLRCTDAKELKSLLNCKYNSDFKQAFLTEKNLYLKLISHSLDLTKLWSFAPSQEYLKKGIVNQGSKIKKLKK